MQGIVHKGLLLLRGEVLLFGRFLSSVVVNGRGPYNVETGTLLDSDNGATLVCFVESKKLVAWQRLDH
jgi:hypothetical protein